MDTPFDSRPVAGSSLDDLDLEVIRATYLPAVVDQEVIEENERPLSQQLASMRLIDSFETPTVLGQLAAGFDPGSYIPGAYIKFVRYQGTDLDAAVSDDQELRSHLIDISIRLEALLRSNLRSRVVPVSELRETHIPDYPIEALRETCMNAIMHRNYETSYAPVRVVWFEDRIEVSNPGGPFGQVRSDNFDRVNDYRNPSLAAAMKALGYVNRFGRGIGRIRSSLRTNGNPPANYQSLMPLSHDARKPMFDLRAADGALGSTQSYVQKCYQDFRELSLELLQRLAEAQVSGHPG